jgi:hypothetical protein
MYYKKVFILLLILPIMLFLIPSCDSANEKSSLTPPLASAPSPEMETKLSLSDSPELGKPVNITFTFNLYKGYKWDWKNTSAQIILPEGFELIESDLESREEIIEDYWLFLHNEYSKYTVLEWHGDVLRDNVYTIQAIIKAVKTGDWEIIGRTEYSHPDSHDIVGGADCLYITVTEEGATVSENQPRFKAEGAPVLDPDNPDEPIAIIPWDKTPQRPEEMPMPPVYSNSAEPTEPDPFEDRVVKSDLIVYGTITDREYDIVTVKSANSTGEFTYTIFTLSVEKVIKGDPSTKQVPIKVVGGLEGTPGPLPTGPYFSITDKILVCLIKEAGNGYTLFPLSPFGVLWVESGETPQPIIIRNGIEMNLEKWIGEVIMIMQNNNIPIALDEPIPIPAEPIKRPE